MGVRMEDRGGRNMGKVGGGLSDPAQSEMIEF